MTTPAAPSLAAEQRVAHAVTLLILYGTVPGAHHKAWLIDQVLRVLLEDEDAYQQCIQEAASGGDPWEKGIAP
jgi:hypothetical protein